MKNLNLQNIEENKVRENLFTEKKITYKSSKKRN